MDSDKFLSFFAGVSLLLCIVPAVDATWPPPVKPLGPPPECGPDKDRCEFTLIASYHVTMVVHRPAAGPQWSPVATRPDGLWIKGSQPDCGAIKRKLGPEESRYVVTGDGNPRMIFAVNGTMPGPPLVVYEGQQVIVHYINHLENEASNLHFHGMHQRGTPWMDGTMMSHCPVGPGETFTYRFKADPHGTYWYHSHLGSTFTMGIQGAFIVLPNPNKPGYKPREDLPPMGADYPVIISDFWKESSSEISLYRRKKLGMYGYGILNDVCYNVTLFADTTLCAHWPFNSIVVNGKGRHYAYDGFRPNNPRLPLEVFQVRKGEKFYFRLICSSLELAMAVSIDKHPLHVVATDGSDIVTTTVDIINISPGERYDFWIDATDPDGTGLYWMRILTMELLRGNWIPMAPHHGSAIIRYDGAPEGTDPTSQRREYTPGNPGFALNCPFQDYGPEYMIRCVNLDALRLLEPDYSTWNVDPSEVVDVFVQNQAIYIPGGYGRVPTYNGVMNEWPAYPVQIYKHTINEYLNNCSKCEFPDPEKGCRCTNLIKIPYGKVVNLVITNNNVMDVRLTMPHPTHIHGHTPQVAKLAWGKYDDKMRMTDVNRDTYCESPICVNGTWWTDPSWNGDNIPGLMGPYSVKKDSLFIGSGSYVVWRFRADNPGFWLLHCHIEYHLTDGMALIMQVGEPEDMPDHPKGMDRCGDYHVPEEDYYRGINFLNDKNKPASSSTAPQPNPAVVPPPPPPPPPAPAVPAAQPAPAPVVPAAPAAPPAPSGGSAVAKGFTRLVQIEEDALQQTQQSLRSFQVITIVLAILCCLMAAGLLLQHWRNSEKKNRSPSGYDLVPEKRPLMDHH